MGHFVVQGGFLTGTVGCTVYTLLYTLLDKLYTLYTLLFTVETLLTYCTPYTHCSHTSLTQTVHNEHATHAVHTSIVCTHCTVYILHPTNCNHWTVYTVICIPGPADRTETRTSWQDGGPDQSTRSQQLLHLCQIMFPLSVPFFLYNMNQEWKTVGLVRLVRILTKPVRLVRFLTKPVIHVILVTLCQTFLP